MKSAAFLDNVNLFGLHNQDDTETALMARIGTNAIAYSISGLEGELVQAETTASAARGSGRRCIDVQAAVIMTDPGVLAERVALDLLHEAADGFCADAAQGTAEMRRDVRARLEQELGPGQIHSLPGESLATVGRIARIAIAEAAAANARTASGIGTLVDSVAEADVTAAASDAAGVVLQQLRSAISKGVRERSMLMAQGRSSEARSVSEAQVSWLADRMTALDRIAEAAAEERDQHLAAANRIVSQDEEDVSASRPSAFARVLASLKTFVFTDAPTTTSTDSEDPSGLLTELRGCLRATIVRATATRLRVACAALQAGSALPENEIERLVGPARTLADRARLAAAHLDEQSRERQRRIRGAYLPGIAGVLHAVRAASVRLSDATLVDRIIRVPLTQILEDGRPADLDAFEDRALASARELTNGVRSASLGQSLHMLPQDLLAELAKMLVNIEPTLKFRAGHVAPQVRRRVAVPGGPGSALGEAIRRRYSNVTIVPSNEPLLALGVVVTEVFSVVDIEDYHTTWREAREEARREGWDKRLVSDRRLLDLDDGITTDEDLDKLVVAAVACDALAASKEPPSSPQVDGTWYLLPPGASQRPSQVEAGRLDFVFAGHRLGRSLPEMRRVLRHSPSHRALIAQRSAQWTDEASLEARVKRFEDLITQKLLPSDELVSACRGLKNALTRELRLSRFEVV